MKFDTVVEEDIDILVCGAGLGGTGAAFEARYWGQDKKIVIAEKANIDRSGACLLYTSPSPRDLSTSRMPSSA